MKVLICLAAVAVLVLQVSEAKQGRGAERSDERRGKKTIYRWERTVGSVNVSQKAFVSDRSGKEAVYLFSHGDDIENENISRSATLYDFNGGNALTITKIRRFCFITPTEAATTFDSVSMRAESFNGTLVEDVLAESLRNATGTRLSSSEVQSLFSDFPRTSKLCRRRPIFRTDEADEATFPDPGEEEEGEYVLETVTLDHDLLILNKRRPRG